MSGCCVDKDKHGTDSEEGTNPTGAAQQGRGILLLRRVSSTLLSVSPLLPGSGQTSLHPHCLPTPCAGRSAPHL